MNGYGDYEGPWIAIDGFLQMTSKLIGRRTFGFIRGLLVSKDNLEDVVSLLNSREYLGNMFIPEEPSDFYTFAGEIPWSKEFASGEDCDEDLGPYKGNIGGYWSNGIIVEVLSHRFEWESYHSSVNCAGGFSVPSKILSQKFNLRALTSSFNQIDENRRLAAISFSPPENFDSQGNILYVREDLLLKYAAEQDQFFFWVVWGERGLTNMGYDRPEWGYEIYQQFGHVWRRIVTLHDFVGTAQHS